MPSSRPQSHRKRRCPRIAFIAMLLLVLISLTGSALHAQEFRGSITGIVADPTGGALPNASVTVQNLDTQAIFRTHTNARGAYFAPSLAPGRYRVHVEAPSFKSFEQVGIILQTGDNPQV